MTLPVTFDAFEGQISKSAVLFVKLNKLGIPIGNLFSLVPDPNVAELDTVDSENFKKSAEVTDYPVPRFGSKSTNISMNPDEYSVTGTIANTILTNAPIPGAGAINSLSFYRFDKVRRDWLFQLMEAREPVGMFGPDHSIPVCAITGIDINWDLSQGESTFATISVKRMNLISPGFAKSVVDETSLTASNIDRTSGGETSATPLSTDGYVDPVNFGVPPTRG